MIVLNLIMNLYNILGGHIVAIKCYVFIKYVLSDSLQKVFVEKNENQPKCLLTGDLG